MSGALDLLLFLMGGAPGAIQAIPNSQNPGSAYLMLNGAGQYTVGNGAGGFVSGPWVLPAGAAPSYEVMVHNITGAAFSGGDPVNTWLPMTASRSWIQSFGPVTTFFDISFRVNGVVQNTQSRWVQCT